MEFILPNNIEGYLETLHNIYQEEGETILDLIVVNAEPAIEEGHEHDNWNGGIDGHLITLLIPINIYVKIRGDIDDYSQRILHDLKAFADTENEYFCGLSIHPQQRKNTNYRWREESGLLQNSNYEAPITADEISEIWKDNKTYRVFLSHKSEDKEQTYNIKNALSRYGVSCFVAHVDIEPGSEWAKAIENAIFSADACVALMSKNYHNSTWTDQEIGCAYGRRIPVILAKIGMPPYGLVGKIQAVATTWEDAPKKLLPLLLKESKMVDAYITACEGCQSFDAGNVLAEALEHISSITEEQIDKLVAAYVGNPQLANSFGFTGGKPALYGPGLAHYMTKWAPARYPNRQAANAAIDKARQMATSNAKEDEDIPF